MEHTCKTGLQVQRTLQELSQWTYLLMDVLRLQIRSITLYSFCV